MAASSSSGTIVILGGTGFIGCRLASRLCHEGYNVRIPTRNRQRHRNLLVLPSAEVVDANIHDPARLKELCAGADAVVNLVGVLNDTSRGSKVFREAHVTLVESLLRVCEEQGVTRLLHVSALKANAERGPSEYLKSKGQAEQLLRAAPASIAWSIFQPSVVFGPEDGFVNRFAMLLRLTPILPLAKPNARFAPVYVEDLVSALMKCLQDRSTAGETYQLCGPQIYSLREMVGLIAAIMGKRRLILGLPDSLSKLQAWIFEHLPGKVFTLDNYRSLTVNSICSENGFSKLGIVPRAMDVVIPRYLAPDDHRRRLYGFRQSAGR